MNLVTITIAVSPHHPDRTYLQAHIAHERGERTWQGTYQGTPTRASLGGIWLALRELDDVRLYKCVVNLKVNQATREIISDFLWQNPSEELLDVYEHLRPLLRKHTILIPSHWTGIQPVELIDQMGQFWGLSHLRTRLPRAAQLVTMGALMRLTEHEWQVFSQTIPNGQPYSVTHNYSQGRQRWQCNCLDTNSACKHILAVAMQSKLTQGE